MENSVIDQAIVLANEEVEKWRNLAPSARKRILNSAAKLLAKESENLAKIITKEVSKPEVDALLEIALAINLLRWSANNANRYLKRTVRPSGILGINTKASIIWKPYGVVGVIGPWNYPVFTPMGSISCALAAGNSVIFKPSPYSEEIGKRLVEILTESFTSNGFPNLLQVLPAENSYGADLAASKIDKLSFTGSNLTARKVAQACAQNLTPLVIEAGGMDPVFIDQNANLSKAAKSVLWSSMSHAGQTCIGAARIYVLENLADKFIAELKAEVKKIDPINGGDYGVMTMPSATATIKQQLETLVPDEAQYLYGGLSSIGNGYITPIIIEKPLTESEIKEEIFGPVIFLYRVPNMAAGIQHANNSPFGLGASYWGKNFKANQLKEIKSGMISVNSVAGFAANGSLPFGGVGESGFGRIHGPEGLKEFAYPQSISREIFSLPVNLASFSFKEKKLFAIKKIIKFFKG